MANLPIPFPFDASELVRKKRALLRESRALPFKMSKKIAILGGSSTSDLRDLLEIFLRQEGIAPEFYESEYGKFYEDAVFGNEALDRFQPDLVYFFTTSMNIRHWPNPGAKEASASDLKNQEYVRLQEMWESIEKKFSCLVIQNNFEEPFFRPLGNLDFSEPRGRVRFVRELNEQLAQSQNSKRSFLVNDIHYLSAWIGLEKWYDRRHWHSYKYAMSIDVMPLVAHQTARLIGAAFGLSKKVLALDLDNTLWGGVIGDEGVKGIQIGKETAEAEGHTEFQEYVGALYNRGVVLAVCSKNDAEIAETGFAHPDSILKRSQISAFEANWNPKDENLGKIARTLNLGIDSIVFVDDNPVERDLVRSQVPAVAVPEVGSDIVQFASAIDKGLYFETIGLSAEDQARNTQYQANEVRESEAGKFKNYEEFLSSLEMKAEIKPFATLYLDRITQLTNKTNQFNLTTRRYADAEIQALMNSDQHLTFYGRLSDKFGEHGLISIIVAEISGKDAVIDLWLMSCRVLKRGMEYAMMGELVAQATQKGLERLIGIYLPTAKNSMVKDFYSELGFQLLEDRPDGSQKWEFPLSTPRKIHYHHIEVNK